MSDYIFTILSYIRKYNPFTAIFITVGGFIISQFIAAILIAVYAQGSNVSLNSVLNDINDKPLMSMLFGLVIYGIYLFIIWIFLKSNKLNFKDIGLKSTKRKSDIILYALAGYGIYFVCTFIVSFIMNFVISKDILQRTQDISYNTSTSGISLIFVFIGLVIIPPIVEEIAMRGFLFTGLRKNLNFWWSGLIVSTLFALAHLGLGSGKGLLWAVAVDTFVLSWILVFVREKSGSIYPTIGIHMIKNLVAFLALFIFKVV